MATYLPQNKFTDSVTPRSPAVTDTAGVSPCPPDAPAGTISVSDGVPVSSLPSVEMEPSATAAYAPSGTEGALAAALRPPTKSTKPSMTNGGDQEAIAGSAPNTAAPAIALDFDWRAFWDFITDERIVLFEPFVEHPMFIIEDGRLQRWEA